MVEKSTYVILLFTSLVLMLSFKDLVFIRTDTTEAATKQHQHQKEAHLYNEDEGDLGSHHDEGFDEENKSQDESSRGGFETSNDDDEFSSHDGNFGGGDGAAQSFEKKIPSLKRMKGTGSVQTLKFKFCYSCGYRNAFEQYKELVQKQFPELKIEGENFTPVAWKLYLAQFLSTFKMMVIGCIIFGFNPFAQFNLPTPGVFNWALQNKFYAAIMLFFLSNSFETHLISTGAFEIYLNDIQIWSKLQSDRMPHEKELMQILDMNFNFESEKNAAFGNAKF